MALFQNLKTSPEAVAEAYFGKGADLAKLNRTILPKKQITVVLPYRDNEGRGFQAQAVLENGSRIRTQEAVANRRANARLPLPRRRQCCCPPRRRYRNHRLRQSTAANLKSERDFKARVAWGDRGPRNSVLVEATRDVASRVLILGLPKSEGEPEPGEEIRAAGPRRRQETRSAQAEPAKPAPQG